MTHIPGLPASWSLSSRTTAAFTTSSALLIPVRFLSRKNRKRDRPLTYSQSLLEPSFSAARYLSRRVERHRPCTDNPDPQRRLNGPPRLVNGKLTLTCQRQAPLETANRFGPLLLSAAYDTTAAFPGADCTAGCLVFWKKPDANKWLRPACLGIAEAAGCVSWRS
jgi:hypothetical protein